MLTVIFILPNRVTSHTAAVWLAYVDTGHTVTYLTNTNKGEALIEHKVTNMPLTKPINHSH